MSTRAPVFLPFIHPPSKCYEKNGAKLGRMRYLVERVYCFVIILEKVPDMTTFFQSTVPTLARELYDSYESFQAPGITSCRFTQAEMLTWLRPFAVEPYVCTKTELGTSGEGRPISLYTIGRGSTQVMLWSQMHGDEPTATMALVDIFSFFAKNPDHALTKTIREKLKLLVIPMLNPDGAERFTRRTAQLIDVNRDALALETPEARMLKETREKYRPEYGFNLHDQDPRMTVGTSGKITAIALLAPSTDETRTDTPVRTRAKKVASTLAEVLNLFIPGHLAKWDDTFEPRAFGDNIQKWGTSTVLIESGGWKGDPNKHVLRKLNCIALLTTFYALAVGETAHADTAVYENIPFNMKLGCDLIIRNALLKATEQTPAVHVDVGLWYERRINSGTGQLEDYATIVEIGDLTPFIALEEEIFADGAELDAERIALNPAAEIKQLLKQKQ
jgi:hypothetical protein